MRHFMQKFHIRLMALVMAATLILCVVPAVSAAETSGSCGDSLTWSFSGDTLTITGSGVMYDYDEDNLSPWYSFREQITVLSLPDGLTNVGNLAFYGCIRVETVKIPDSVTAIGQHAFHGCTAMTMLDLGSGLTSIGDSAFRECIGLPALRLPGSLKSIGSHAFYRCESLTDITVPASVTSLGDFVFSFCYNLYRADIQAQIKVMPSWTFYGCGRLVTLAIPESMASAEELAFYGCSGLENVIYTGSEENAAQIREDIDRDLSNSPNRSEIVEKEPEDSSSVRIEQIDDGYILSLGTTSQTGDASISTDISTTYTEDNTEQSREGLIKITLETADGWKDVESTLGPVVEEAEKTDIHIYIKDNSTLSDSALTSLAGKNATVTVHTASGSVWKVDCSQLNADKKAWNMACERTNATEDQLAQMECAVGYQIRFLENAVVNSEVMIRLPLENAGQTATLFMVQSGELMVVQSVVVDQEGYAHFYLASVDNSTTYLLGINAPAADSASAVIPESMYNQYGVSNMSSSRDYIVTGRTSSWGLNFNQVTWIMVAVLFVVVLTVGLTMYALNRRKLQQGYVPDLDDDEEQ